MLKQNRSVPVVLEAKSAQELEAPKASYTAPQMFVVGQTVELIQGRNGGPYRDMHTGFYYNI